MKRVKRRRGTIRTLVVAAAASLVVGATAVGCGEAVFPTDRVEDESHGEARQGGAVSGRYVPPREVIRAGDRQVGSFSYIGAGDTCSGRMLDGSQRLGSFLVEAFDGAAFYQGYNCRTIRGGSGLSMHGTGRAVDVFIPTVGGEADNDLGDPVANYLIRNASKLGVQFFIWDRSKWNIEYGGPEYYGGSHPHYDHLHIELTPYAARNLRDFPAPGGGEPDCEPFIDICDSPFEDDIRWMADEGITNGCGGEKFCPRDELTRGQLAVFFDRAFDLPDGPDAFDDDDGHPFEDAINAMAAAGITNGCGSAEYCPDETVTRGQIAAFLSRVLSLPSSTRDAFDDDDGSHFEDAINALAAAGITNGCGDRRYCPDRAVRRGPFAAFLHRASRH